MIIIDDYSSDNTLIIAKNIANKDKRIKIISHKNNWGIKKLKNTYNQALKLSRGNLIAILEGDDFWPKDKLEKQIDAFKDKDIVLSYGNWAMTNQSGKIVYVRNYKKLNKKLLANTPTSSILNLFLTLKFDLGSQTVMIRKRALSEIGGFKDDQYYPFTDIPTYLYLTLKGKFSYIPLLLGYYRRTENSSWFKHALSSNTMGKEEKRNCVNKFIKIKAIFLSITINWKKIEREQDIYLFKRKIFHFLSVFFNQLLFKKFLTNKMN